MYVADVSAQICKSACNDDSKSDDINLMKKHALAIKPHTFDAMTTSVNAM